MSCRSEAQPPGQPAGGSVARRQAQRVAFIHPFEGYLVAARWAGAVVAPLYDPMTPEERRRHAETHPESYLNAMRSAEDFVSGHAPGLPALHAENVRFLRAHVDNGRFVARPSCVLVYRLASGGHVQRGVVAEMPIDAYLDGRIRRHEFTRVAREDALAEYIDRVRTASSPVSLAYRSDDGIRDLLDTATEDRPTVSHTTEDGVEHDIWVLEGADAKSLIDAFGSVSTAYLTDGHHRCAATARFSTAGAEVRLLVVLFPDDELRILPFHRVVRDLGEHSTDSFLAGLAESFTVEPLPGGDPDAAQPRARGEFAVHVDDRWFRFRLPGEEARPSDPAGAIDAAILQARVIGPLLGITDPRDDERLDYVAGAGGLAQLERACREGWRAAFALHPTSMDELVAVADAGAVMPPKSTWFDPKPRSGFFFHDPLRLCGR